MGGVDLMDSHIGKHHIKIKSKKWYFRIFYHMLDMVVVNSWILHKSVSGNPVSQKQFRTELALTLLQLGTRDTPKRGRPSDSPQSQKRLKASATVRPPQNVTRDKTDHWPLWDPERNRCKMENCKGKTNIVCSKCKLNLCVHATKNSFQSFHVQKSFYFRYMTINDYCIFLFPKQSLINSF